MESIVIVDSFLRFLRSLLDFFTRGMEHHVDRIDWYPFEIVTCCAWMCLAANHPMLSNFLQKPIGIVTILGAAVGGPYAAFETDVGTQLRTSFVARLAQSPGPSSSSAPNDAADPFSLMVANGSNRSQPTSSSPTLSWNQNQPNLAGTSATMQNAPSDYSHFTSNGQVVSTVYGPATIQPVGPAMPYSIQGSPASFPVPYLANRAGPASAIPGKTDQLWDYTLGTPTLNQIQQQPNATVGGGAVYDLREVLRFDIVPGWLPQRFARVSTVTSNVQMDGLRVPLITGTQPKDIAGTLTYYFDSSQALKRINLHGLTGDPTQLAYLMAQFYQLKLEQSLGGQLFTTRWNNRITSVLQIAPAPIIYAGADHSKYIIFLELNQPTNQYGLSDEASEILRTSQATQRW